MGVSMGNWRTEFPFFADLLFDHDDIDGIRKRQTWCNENIGAQDEKWCLIHTVYCGSRQFRFREINSLVLYTMVWE